MWPTFFLCMLAAILVLYLPGYFVCRSLDFKVLLAVSCAPVTGIALYAILSIIYGFLGIPCSWVTVFLPILIVALGIFLVFKVRHKRVVTFGSIKIDCAILLLYVVIGFALCLFIFVKSLDGPASYHCRNDNITHLNLARSFYESGIWSSLTTSNFLPSDVSQASYATTYFYPAAWHGLVALVLSFVNCEVTIGVNAVNAVVAGIVFPVSVYSFIRTLFPNNRLASVVGAFTALAFTAFPWGFLIKGPLYPNHLSLSLVPAVLAAYMEFLNSSINKKIVIRLVVFSIFTLAALALSQTNALFTAFVFAVAYIGHTLHVQIVPSKKTNLSLRLQNIRFYSLYALAVIVIWLAMYCFPPIRNVTTYELAADVNLDLVDGVFNTISFSFMTAFPQWPLVGATILGAIYLIATKRLWITLPGAYMLFTYLMAKVFFGYPKLILAGFWYSDPWRIASCAAIFLIPVATMGIVVIIKLLNRAINALLNSTNSSTKRLSAPKQLTLCTLSALLVFSCWNYFPSYDELRGSERTVTPFGYIKGRISNSYSKSREQIYSATEEEFVQKVMDTIPEDALVINMPLDGSVLAYGVDGLNAYFRYKLPKDLTDESAVIRSSLDEVATNQEVRDILKSIGAEYVLLLDQGATLENGKWFDYQTQKGLDTWEGIASITDETPGFEVVLSDGDMRLYKIETE